MSERILALTVDGRITYCTAPEELRGKGRCNHVAHQNNQEPPAVFLARVTDLIKSEDKADIPDEKELINSLVSKYATNSYNPDWDDIISQTAEGYFNIGKEDTFEQAHIASIDKKLSEDGTTYSITGNFEFRGKVYPCDLGEIPVVQEDGTICMGGSKWRYLPMLEQWKAGVASYSDNVVIRTDSNNIAIRIEKNTDDEICYIDGAPVPFSAVENYFKNGDTSGLSSNQVYRLKEIDPIAFERFPNLRNGDLHEFKNLPEDIPGDISWHRCLRYEDVIKEQYELQFRRMGNTFRQNLARRQNSELSEEELDKKYPLFYQQNLKENIRSELVGRSNCQNADNLNPIAALSQSQKISFTGKGGYNKDNIPYSLRMPNKTHYGIIDPMDISSGKNVGATGTLTGGYIGKDGIIHKKTDDMKSLSPSDFIPFKNYNDPNRAIMAVAHMKQACPIIGGEDPIVKTKAWEEIPGSKLGVNLNVVYIPMSGNFEDAVVISESAAKRMTTIQSHTFSCSDTSSLKVGQQVERKQKFGNWEVRYPGVVKSISNGSVEIESEFPMGVGDKLAGRHGNKSVVSKVLPDNKMPILTKSDGSRERAQVIMSPLSVVGRKNVGQVMECNETFGDGANISTSHKVILNNGKEIDATCGKQFIMRLNHIAEKKLSSNADKLAANRENDAARVGEMESILLTQNEDRLKILDYLRHQEASDAHNKLNNLLKSVGVSMTGVNWDK